MNATERAASDQNDKRKTDAELMETVQDTVVQLNRLLDRLERFTSSPTETDSGDEQT